MTKAIRKAIESLKETSESAAISVAEHLETVASNGGQQATDESMKTEAEALRSWSNVIIHAINTNNKKKPKKEKA